MQWTLRRSVGVNVGAEFRVVIKIGVLNALGGEFESLRLRQNCFRKHPQTSIKVPDFSGLLVRKRLLSTAVRRPHPHKNVGGSVGVRYECGRKLPIEWV